MRKRIDWCKDNFFGLASLFLLAFVPLYPKLPLFDVLQTWVYIRVEDLLIAGILLAFVISQIRQKKIPNTYLTWPIATYWGIGIVSAVISIFFIGPKLMTYAPHLTVLHFLRRIEYMMLFFVSFSMMAKNRKFLVPAIWTIGATVFLVALYGAGQKFFGFPAFLTMNEEFAKGIPLRLPPTARIPSTFGGHYDLGAYMVMMIPVLGSIVFGIKRWWEKLVFLVLTVAGLVTLLFTASRISFGVYLVAITSMLIWQKKKFLIVPVIVASMLFLNSVSSASERFYKTFRYSDVIVDLSSGKPIGTLDRLEGGKAVLEEIERPDEENLPKGSEFISVATGPSDQAQSVETIVNRKLATGSGEIATVSGSFLIQKALVYDISITTRFQGQWPKAIEAFKRNVLLGSGYSTLSVASDGDYLRMLGETGILGSIAFLGILGVAFELFLRRKDSLPVLERSLVIGIFAGIVGLLFNAVLIDVFEASKVAYSLWLLLGIAVAILSKDQLSMGGYLASLLKFFTRKSMYVVYICLFAIFYHIRSLSWYFIGDDFTWLRWAAESKFSDIPSYFTQSAGFFFRPIPKLWYLMLYSIFWLKPGMYHFLSLLMLAGTASFVYLIAAAGGIPSLLSFAGALLFVAFSSHHENIYWISGQSSLLAAFFLFGSVYVWQRVWLGKNAKRPSALPGVLLLSLSMFSYDGLVVAPFIVWLLGALLYRQPWLQSSWVLLLTPLYWIVRSMSGALAPSGDYGYKLATFFPNAVGNALGYLATFFAGPQAIEWMTVVRSALRTNRTLAVILALVFVFVVLRLIQHAWKNERIRPTFVWFFVGLVSLLAYMGLGGMAERYMFAASGFWTVGLVSFAYQTGRSHGKTAYILLAVLFAVLVAWNVHETGRLMAQWEKASSITQQSILTIKRQYFPLDNQKAFVVVNLPTRYGRAWIFPAGFSDALWHMFRMNAYGYTVYTASSIAEALTMPVGKQTHEVLVFEGDNFELRRVTKETYTPPPKQ